MSNKISINCVNFRLRDEMRSQICAAAEKLFHQELHVSALRLTLEGDYNRRSTIIYKLGLLLELRSSEIIVCDQAEQLMPGILSLIDQAERQLLERFYLRQREAAMSPSPLHQGPVAFSHGA